MKPVQTSVAILAAAGDPEWGVEKIRADEAWVDGVLGQGIVVANVDTGVEFTHPALIEQYRGNLGGGDFDHNYNWWDPTGICGDEPCDNVGHGTHTMGTMVGGDGPGPFTPDTGVAPGAQWMAAKGCEDFGCSDIALLSAGQFILEPTDLAGENPDGSKRPDIVNNSWGGGPGSTFYLEIVQAWRTAGIIPVFSSGNPGPFCGEGGSPGDYLESFSSGATDINDQIAEFSGRGPSAFGKINPDVSAPGVNVVSSVPGGGYEAFDGTSMAAPHVAGALALMLSAEPALRGDFAAATDALRATAVDRIDESCGGDEDGDPNNVYGEGRIDAKAAVDLVATGGTLAGTITDSATDAPDRRRPHHRERRRSRFHRRHRRERRLRPVPRRRHVPRDRGSVRLLRGLRVRRRDRHRRDHGPGLLARAPAAVHRQRHDHRRPRTARPSRVRTSRRSARRSRRPRRMPAATTRWSCRSAPTCSTRAPTAARNRPRPRSSARSRTRSSTRTSACSASSMTSGTRAPRSRSTGSTRPARSALYGDEFVGRLRLPFEFPFYDGAYEQIYLSDNGYMNFLAPEQYNNFPQSIPSVNPPNAAIYALWQDLYLDAGSSIDYELIGTAPDRAFVISYSNIKAFGSTGTNDFQVKLWESGNIDLLYGPNAPNPGDGRNATVGIEDASGTDALQLGFMEPILTPNSATRITVVPTGIATGVVTDANDGSPIVGATVTAQPGGRSATDRRDRHVPAPAAARQLHADRLEGSVRSRLQPRDHRRWRGAHGRLRAQRRDRLGHPDRDHRDHRLRRHDHRPDHHREHRLGRPDLGSQGAPARRDHARSCRRP